MGKENILESVSFIVRGSSEIQDLCNKAAAFIFRKTPVKIQPYLLMARLCTCDFVLHHLIRCTDKIMRIPLAPPSPFNPVTGQNSLTSLNKYLPHKHRLKF